MMNLDELDNMEGIQLADPNSEALKVVQQHIEKQLLETQEELKLEIKEAEEANKRANAERETIGVELYNRQQQLAQFHETNEKCDENLNTIRQVRRGVEVKRQEMEKTHERQLHDLKQQEELNKHYKVELDKLNLKLLQVHGDRDGLQSNLKIFQKIAYKKEEQISEAEKGKREQDVLIDYTNQEIRKLQKEIHFIQEQYKEQKRETKHAKEILVESKIEKEELEFRKKTLLQQWKSSLVGMQKRDQTLEVLVQKSSQERENVKEKENEITGFETSIRNEKEELEKNANALMREENKEVYLEKQEADVNNRIESIASDFSQLKKTLDNVEHKLRVSEIEKKKEEAQIKIYQKKYLTVSNKIRDYEKERLEIMSDETTFEKGTSSVKQEIEKIRLRITDREIDIANYENEIARIKIDILQTNNHNKSLEKILADLEVELKTKLTMIDKYKIEIKKKHDEIEKKQGILDKANRELERLKANQQEENFGPLEAEIHNLQREIIAKEKENEQLNKNWIRQQSELVALMNKSEQITMGLKGLSSKRTILYQQHLRLAAKAKQEDNEIRKMTNNIKLLHDVMKKTNAEISKHDDLQNLLSNENLDLKNKILARIKEREQESRKLDETIKSEMKKKADLTNELLEMEKQIMFWEKKIELQIEIQKTLDPEVGQDEIRKMKKEIHIMEQRLDQLKRETKKKVQLMTRAIGIRGIIKAKGVANQKKKKNTKASVTQDVKNLEQILRSKKNEKKRKVREIKQLTAKIERIAIENQEIDSLNKTIEADLMKTQEQIQISLLQRNLLLCHCQKDQSLIQDIQRGKFKSSKLGILQDKQNTVSKIISEMKQAAPNFEVRLSLIDDYLNSES